MSREELEGYNPWRKDGDAIGLEQEIRAWRDSELGWDPRESQAFGSGDCVCSLRGPRQVGKTTLVKLEIERVLGEVRAQNVMYYSFDVENSPRDIVNVVNDYLTFARHDRDGRHYIWLDGISGIRDWQKGIKKLGDRGRLQNCTVVTTGSHSTDLRRATELLPGRRGTPGDDTLDRVLLPMRFREFAPSTSEEVRRSVSDRLVPPPGDRASILRNLAGEITGERLAGFWMLRGGGLDACLDNYLVTGGMPMVANEFLKSGRIRDTTYHTYAQTMMGDLSRAGRDGSRAARLLPGIIKSVTRPVSLRSLMKGSDIGSHNTVNDYLMTLSDMFVTTMFYRYDPSEDGPRFSGGRKVYFQDPFFMHALNGMIKQGDPYKMSLAMLDDPESKGRLVEQAVADHCRRLAFDLSKNKPGFSPELSAFYWRGRDSREVDFVIRDGDSLIPVDVRYRGGIRDSDMRGLLDFARATGRDGGIMVTRDEVGVKRGMAMIPASIFLLLV